MFSDILYSLTIYPIEFILETIFYYFKVATQSSYTVSVILVSLIINILSLPLYNIAEKWQQKERDMQSKMKPMIDNIKSVYKGDQAYLLIRTCQRINGYKTIYAFRGVLGLLIQIPFFLAGYNFFTSLTGANTESFWLIKSLGEPDKIIHIGNYYINLLPFVMTAFSLASTFVYSKKLTFKELQSEATTSGDNDENDDPAPTGPLYTVVDNNSNGVVDAGDNINFGLYPTTIKEDNVTIDTTSQDADGYYTGSDGEKYAMVEVTDSNRAYEHNLDYSNGSQVSIGNAYFKVEPIVWVVLDVDAQGNATLWTEKIIGRQDIDNAAYVGNKYQEWLTNEFLNTVFTSYERDILNPITVGSDQDLISIMRLEDMINTEYGFNSSMFQSDPERRKYVTDYAMAQGATISVDQTSGALDYYLCGSYMISNETSTMVYQITTSGRTTDVSYTLSAGVVPTVNIQLDSTTISGATE